MPQIIARILGRGRTFRSVDTSQGRLYGPSDATLERVAEWLNA